MVKIVINKCYGGFGINEKAVKELRKMKNVHAINKAVLNGEKFKDGDICNNFYGFDDIPRTNPDLIKLIESGFDVNTNYSDLSIVEIPDCVEWEIEEYDGVEWISEKHRTWS